MNWKYYRRLTATTLMFLTYKAIILKSTERKSDGYCEIEWWLKARWYSPLFILWVIACLPIAIYNPGLKEFFGQVADEFRQNDVQGRTFNWEPNVSERTKKFSIWKLVYDAN